MKNIFDVLPDKGVTVSTDALAQVAVESRKEADTSLTRLVEQAHELLKTE